MDAVLGAVPEGGAVALVTLLGSLCPVTHGHVQCFEEARRLLLSGESPAGPSTTTFQEYTAILAIPPLSRNSSNDTALRQRGFREKHHEGHSVGLTILLQAASNAASGYSHSTSTATCRTSWAGARQFASTTGGSLSSSRRRITPGSATRQLGNSGARSSKPASCRYTANHVLFLKHVALYRLLNLDRNHSKYGINWA